MKFRMLVITSCNSTGDPKRLEAVEAAYDNPNGALTDAPAKIKVPEGIRLQSDSPNRLLKKVQRLPNSHLHGYKG